MNIQKFCDDNAKRFEDEKVEGDSFVTICVHSDANENLSVLTAFSFYSRQSLACALHVFLQEALKTVIGVNDEILRIKLEHLVEEAQEVKLMEGLSQEKRIEREGMN